MKFYYLVFVLFTLLVSVSVYSGLVRKDISLDYATDDNILTYDVCDDGNTILTAYATGTRVLGTTISIRGILRYYLVIENPASFSSTLTWFSSQENGDKKEVSYESIRQTLLKEAPSIDSWISRKPTDCKIQESIDLDFK